MKINKLTFLFLLLLFLPLIAFSVESEEKGEIYKEDMDSCVKCHTDPPYSKDQIGVLKDCLACHGEDGHPYKKEAQKPQNIDNYLKSHKEEIKKKNSKNHEDMIKIPEGEFIMGTNTRHRDEQPEHIVYLDAFYIDKHEVTNEDYKKFVDDVSYDAPSHWKNGKVSDLMKKHPVVYVSWFDADNYCKWKGKRLPREREWEKASRGTDGRMFPWGNMWDMNKSNNPIKESTGTEPIGSYEDGKSPYGLYDTSGNVWEWVDDYYLGHPGQEFESPEYNRKYRLLKGGSWWNCMYYSCGLSAPTFNRSFFEPETKNNSFGFRCAKDGDEK